VARTVTLSGSNYSIPDPGDKNYDQALTNFLVALATAFVGNAGNANVPTGLVNGSNATFTLPSAPTGALLLFVDRVVQIAGVDYTLSSATITFNAGAIPQTGALIRAYY
jgi:hypothetical protein